MKFIILIGVCICFVVTGHINKNNNQTKSMEVDNKIIIINLKQTKPNESGIILYQQYCLACHQADGSGVPGMYPPLKKNELVGGDKSTLIKTVLNGLTGEIIVNGKRFNQTMPPQNNLSDPQIAGILTYIRSHFGNMASSVISNDIANLRLKK